MLKCVIIDDEPLAREVVEGHLKKLDFIESVTQFRQCIRRTKIFGNQ
jgi:DNA-binding LytR/AlgR family response regulator